MFPALSSQRLGELVFTFLGQTWVVFLICLASQHKKMSSENLDVQLLSRIWKWGNRPGWGPDPDFRPVAVPFATVLSSLYCVTVAQVHSLHVSCLSLKTWYFPIHEKQVLERSHGVGWWRRVWICQAQFTSSITSETLNKESLWFFLLPLSWHVWNP